MYTCSSSSSSAYERAYEREALVPWLRDDADDRAEKAMAVVGPEVRMSSIVQKFVLERLL